LCSSQPREHISVGAWQGTFPVVAPRVYGFCEGCQVFNDFYLYEKVILFLTNPLQKSFVRSISYTGFSLRESMMIKKVILGFGLLCLLASPVLAFGGANAPVKPSPVVKDLPLPTLPLPARPRAKHFCGEGC
jgi:hypothetical protein